MTDLTDKITMGRRYDLTEESWTTDNAPRAGDYGHERDGHWYCICPSPDELWGNLSAHEVIEHEDGTITVSPSILVTMPHKNLAWHGWLEKGIWRTAE